MTTPDSFYSFMVWIFDSFWRWLGLFVIVASIAEGLGGFVRGLRK